MKAELYSFLYAAGVLPVFFGALWLRDELRKHRKGWHLMALGYLVFAGWWMLVDLLHAVLS